MTSKFHNNLAEIIIAADNGDPDACDKIIDLFDKGMSEEEFKNHREKAYLSLAKAGDPNAMCIMGELTDGDIVTSYNWYLKAANAGNTRAMLCIGYRYTSYPNAHYPNTSYGYDNNKAAYWFLKALDYGDSEGARLYAEMCCENDRNAHKEYLMKAIKMNNLEALENYGDLYYYNEDINDQDANEKKAKEIYIEVTRFCSKEEDLPIFERVCSKLGNIYGHNVHLFPAKTPEDVKNGNEAIMWLCCAAYANSDDADEYIDTAVKIANNCNIIDFNGDYMIKVGEALDKKFKR